MVPVAKWRHFREVVLTFLSAPLSRTKEDRATHGPFFTRWRFAFSTIELHVRFRTKAYILIATASEFVGDASVARWRLGSSHCSPPRRALRIPAQNRQRAPGLSPEERGLELDVLIESL